MTSGKVVQLLHQIWEDPDSASLELCVATRAREEQRRKLEPRARLLHSFHASSYLEAMDIYHEWNGWERYVPIPGFEYESYTEAQFRMQRAEGYDV